MTLRLTAQNRELKGRYKCVKCSFFFSFVWSPLFDRFFQSSSCGVVFVLVGWLDKSDEERRILVEIDGTYFRIMSRKKQLKSLSPGSYVFYHTLSWACFRTTRFRKVGWERAFNEVFLVYSYFKAIDQRSRVWLHYRHHQLRLRNQQLLLKLRWAYEGTVVCKCVFVWTLLEKNSLKFASLGRVTVTARGTN